jgi:hypothetical protein
MYSCQIKKKKTFSQETAGLLKSVKNQQPFKKVGIDFIGPFPLTKTWNRYIIVAVDYLIKWVMAKPVPHAGTREVIVFFNRRIVLQHGARYLIFDS